MRLMVMCWAALSTGLTPALAGPSDLVPHRAVYDLSLKEASERSGIDDMRGRMVYEFNGSQCDGYTVQFRFVTQIDTGEAVRVTDQQTTTYEDIRDHRFDFVTKSYVNDSLDHEIKGSANIDGAELKVDLDQPKDESLDLSPALFPTEHLLELLTKAEAGETFYQSRIFDGSDEGDESLMTTTVVGKEQGAEAGDPELDKAKPLEKERFWPVAISYFNDEGEGDGVPIYSIAFKLYRNGVTRDLTMDYGDFALEGELAELEYLQSEPCAN
ncbi:MAG: ATP-binding protein [Rhizobiales bacterium]|nr:ATP-binding protein [Hyphomicrobiales bacterium]MBA70027.1 ATP-binding protein [Hyphomicrobiales bacterium]|tara:strand:+ start:268 stop:1077 length:810 start_codon:yes stop_codon:yes gene_type:complete